MNDNPEYLQPILKEKEFIENSYPIKVIVHRGGWGAFTGGGGEVITIAFIVGALAGGFFSEVGKDLYSKTKEMCKKLWVIVKKSKKMENSPNWARVVLDFEYKEHRIVAYIDIRTDNIPKIEQIYNGVPLDFFWENLPSQVSDILQSIDKGSQDESPNNIHTLTLSREEKKLMLTEYNDFKKAYAATRGLVTERKMNIDR